MDNDRIAAAYLPAAQQALPAFALRPGPLQLVSMSENVTFRVSDLDSGTDYVLRLHRPGYHTLAELIAERHWVRALDRAGIAVPRPIAARDGSDYVAIAVAATGEIRQAGMAHWIEGELLAEIVDRSADAASRAAWFGRLGSLIAALHLQAATWTPPADFVRHHLDRDGLMGEAPFWGPFWEHASLSPGERRLLIETRDSLRTVLQRYGQGADRWGPIHADLHANNVLVNGGGLAIIDFDDCAFGWFLYDIAVALIRHQTEPDFAALERALIEGYRRCRPLPDRELALLPMFRLIRGLAQIGWYHQRPELNPKPYFAAMKEAVFEQCRAHAKEFGHRA